MLMRETIEKLDSDNIININSGQLTYMMEYSIRLECVTAIVETNLV